MTNIYVMKNYINDKVYIGQTECTLKERLIKHRGQCTYDNSSIHRAMRSLGKYNFYIELLESVPNDMANDAEVMWMNHFSSIGYELYNDKRTHGKCGGDTLSNHINKEEIGQKIRAKCTGGNNSNASKIMVTNLVTGEQRMYDCMKDCQNDMNIERHDIISRRCRGIIKKPYLGIYEFTYV